MLKLNHEKSSHLDDRPTVVPKPSLMEGVIPVAAEPDNIRHDNSDIFRVGAAASIGGTGLQPDSNGVTVQHSETPLRIMQGSSSYFNGLDPKLSPYQAGLAAAANVGGVNSPYNRIPASTTADSRWRSAQTPARDFNAAIEGLHQSSIDSRQLNYSAASTALQSTDGLQPFSERPISVGVGGPAEFLGPEFDDLRNKLNKLNTAMKPSIINSDDSAEVTRSDSNRTPSVLASSNAAVRTELAQLKQEKIELVARQNEQLRVVRECLAERDRLRRTDIMRQDALAKFRTEITTAVDRLTSERADWLKQIDSKNAEIAALKTQVADGNANTATKVREAETAAEESRRLKDQLASVMSSGRAATAELEDRLSREHAQQQSELDRIRSNLADAEAKHANALAEKDRTIVDLKAANRELQAQCQQVQSDRNAAAREREALQSELALQQARNEAEKAGLVSKLKSQLEREGLAKLAQEQDRAAAEIAESRETHRKQIAQLTERHTAEVTELRAARQKEAKRRTQEMEAEQNRHRREMDDLMWKLQEAQGKLRTLSATVKSREVVHSDAVTKLGTELQDTLRAQFASVSKVANELANASQTLTEETKSIVDDVSSELDPSNLDLNLPSGNEFTALRAQQSMAGRIYSGSLLRVDNLGLLPSSPARGIKLLHANNLRLAESATRTTQNADNTGANLPNSLVPSSTLAQPKYPSDRALLKKAVANLSQSSKVLNYSPKPVEPREVYIPDNAQRHSPRSATAALKNKGVHLSSTRSDLSIKDKLNKRSVRRDYEKPWLAGRAKTPGSAISRASTVDQVYR